MNLDQFLLDDYKLKVGFLSNQYNGMWTRFNYFVAIQSALIGGKFIFGGGEPVPALAWFGFFLSLIWYVFGAEDSYLARLYQKHVMLAAEALLAKPGLKDVVQPYPHVGFSQDKETDIDDEVRKEHRPRSWQYRITGWRWDPISVSKLIALVPLLAWLAWAGILISQYIH